MFQLDLATGL
ncbi:unnamed protein product, partial [Rotaria socialis]